MKRKILMLGFALLSVVIASASVTFTEGNSDGVSITYQSIDDTFNVKVISNTTTPYSGTVNIPEKVNHNRTDYIVTEIGDYAFIGTSVTSVSIPRTVTTIGESAFQKCASLSSVTFAEGSALKSIGNLAFFNCTELLSMAIPDAVTEIGQQAFSKCAKLTVLKLGKSVETIGTEAFNECTSLLSVVFPYSVATINNDAFYGCSSLSTVTIGASVRTMGVRVFAYCNSISSIKVYNAKPREISVGNATFSSDVLSNATLLIPAGSLSNYNSVYADPWKNFTNKIEFSNAETLVEGIPYTDSDNSWHTSISYTRDYTDTEGWQALYLPFDLSYDTWSALGEIAELTSINSSGSSLNSVNFTKKTEGTLLANTPCVFYPNTRESITFSTQNETLYAAPGDDSPVECTGFTLYGTYTTKEGLYEQNAYALSADGAFVKAVDAEQTLNPFRIYLIANGGYAAPPRLNITVDDKTTAIGEIEWQQELDNCYYDLMGRRIENPQTGIYIKNGKKIFIK